MRISRMFDRIITWASANILAVAVASVLEVPALSAQCDTSGLRVSHVRGSVHRIDGAIDVVAASIGSDGVLLVDAGYPGTVAGLRSAVRQLGGRDIKILLNTHWHHAFANDSFGERTTIIAHRRARDRTARANVMAGRIISPRTAKGQPAVAVDDSLSIYFNGERITLLHLPNAHTDGDVVVTFHTSRVVMTGDVFVPHLPWIDRDSGGRLSGLRTAIDRLLRVIPRDATIIPGHGPTSTYEDLQRFRDMLDANVDATR